MSAVLTARQICERALGAIGAFPTSESAALPEHLRRAMEWLDMIMAHRAGVGRLFFLVPATISLTITNGTGSYNLDTALGSELPVDKIQFPVRAWVQDSAGNRYPVEIVTKEKFEANYNADTTGRPEIIHIDRLPTSPILRTYPTPASDDTETWTLKLDVQTYAPNVAPAGVTGNQPSGAILTKFRQAWQLWLVWELCHALGCGPIYTLPSSEREKYRKEADRCRIELEVYENQEHDTEPPIGCDAWDGPLPVAQAAWSTLGD